MPKIILTEARVRSLGIRKTTYDIRDGKLRGFGVRVLTSGRKRFFVHCQHRAERVWKVVGDAAIVSVDEARSHAAEMLVAIRRGEGIVRLNGLELQNLQLRTLRLQVASTRPAQQPGLV